MPSFPHVRARITFLDYFKYYTFCEASLGTGRHSTFCGRRAMAVSL